jgi:hypothetical protein
LLFAKIYFRRGILKNRENLFILLSPEGIYGYISKVLRAWDIQYRVTRSCRNSWYIKMELGTSYQPDAVHIRISDHDAVHETSMYDFDVMCQSKRDGVRGINPVTYLILLEILAVKLDREIPPLCRTLLNYRKEHAVELQYNRRHQAWKLSGRKLKFYLNAS